MLKLVNFKEMVLPTMDKSSGPDLAIAVSTRTKASPAAWFTPAALVLYALRFRPLKLYALLPVSVAVV